MSKPASGQPPLRLTLLKGTFIERAGVTVPWPQRGWQRESLLALLADAGARGIARTRLAAMLWPDSDDAAARHSLDELLSRTRRDLGESDLFIGSTSVALNPEVIASDVGEFWSALQVHAFERAVALWGGEFAEGLRMGPRNEVEDRIAAARTRYLEEYGAALRALASRASAAGDHGRAAAWRRRLVELRPVDGDVVFALIQSLTASNDRAGARTVAEAYVERCREEGMTADSRIHTWMKRAPDSTGGGGGGDGTVGTGVAGRRSAQITRLLGPEYRLGPLVDKSSLVETYTAQMRDGGRRDVHVVLTGHLGDSGTADFVEVFQRVAHLAHPGIVPVFDVHASDEVWLFTTGSVPLANLRSVLKDRGPLPFAQVADLGLQLADALAYAHRAGVAHGDLRPRYAAVLGEGVTLGGFGFGELFQRRRRDDTRSTVLTFGSPGYQSPEQLTGSSANLRSADIYALGVILFEMVAGRVPFPVSQTSGHSDKLRSAPPLLRELRETTPPELEELVSRCLARYAADRFPDMESVLRGLIDIKRTLRVRT